MRAFHEIIRRSERKSWLETLWISKQFVVRFVVDAVAYPSPSLELTMFF
jgi:hypothetical protein